MKLAYTFEMVPLGGEIVAVPVGASAADVQGVIKVNTAGARIMEFLRADTTEDAVVASLSAEYENDPAELAAYVHKFVQSLDEVGVLTR